MEQFNLEELELMRELILGGDTTGELGEEALTLYNKIVEMIQDWGK